MKIKQIAINNKTKLICEQRQFKIQGNYTNLHFKHKETVITKKQLRAKAVAIFCINFDLV